MAVVPDILHSLRQPRAAIRRKLDQGPREDRALAMLMGGCLLLFVAQWPRLAREAQLEPSVPLEARLGGALLGLMFVLPLLLYGVAAVSHLIARAMGGKGSFSSARLALFWALLTAAPLFLLHGLIMGFVGQGAQLWVGLLVLAGFLYLWITMLQEAERSA